jgi:hypothetical protein
MDSADNKEKRVKPAKLGGARSVVAAILKQQKMKGFTIFKIAS